MKDQVRFKQVMTVLCENYGKELSEGLIKLYWTALSELTDDDFAKRAYSHIRSSRFFPTVADFLDDSDDIDIEASKAYVTAKEAAIEVGVYKNVDFEDKAITATIEGLFGTFKEFHDLVAYPDRDDTFVRKEFIDYYKKIKKRPEKYLNASILRGYLSDSSTQTVKVLTVKGGLIVSAIEEKNSSRTHEIERY